MTGVVPCRVLVGYDGSPQADRAIAVAGALLPQAHAAIATVAHSFMPSPELLHEILNERENVTIDDLAARLREMGEAEASATAERGAERAREQGWEARAIAPFSRQGVWFELVDLARCDPRPDVRRQEVEQLGRQPSRDAHAGDVLGGLDLDRRRRGGSHALRSSLMPVFERVFASTRFTITAQ